MRLPCDQTSVIPPVAEAARSAVAAATTPVLVTDAGPREDAVQAWHTMADGHVLISVSADDVVAAVAAAGDLPARLDLLDATAVPMRDRFRGHLSLGGWLSMPAAGPSLGGRAPRGCRQLHLEVSEVELNGVHVDMEDYAAAVPDPLGPREAAALHRLVRQHPEGFRWLLPASMAGTAVRVVPLRLHRRALVLRVERHDGENDVAIPLPRGRRAPLPQTAVEILVALDRLMATCPHESPQPGRARRYPPPPTRSTDPSRQSEGGSG